MSRTVLVLVDGSDHSMQALSYALHHHEGDKVIVLHVVNPLIGEYGEETPGGMEKKRSEVVIEMAQNRFENANLQETLFEVMIREGRPQDVIVSYAEEADVDQIVMGTRGLTGVRRMVLGSVADSVIRRSSVPVNVVPDKNEG